MNQNGTKSNLAWIVNILGFLILLGGIIFAAGQNREKTTTNAEYIAKVDNMNTIAHAGLNSDVKGIYDLLYKQNGQIEQILGELKYLDRRDCK